MVHDWWFAAAPTFATAVGSVSADWASVEARLRRLRLPSWSHHIWPLLIHERLNATQSVRFKAGVRIGLARHTYNRVRSGCVRHEFAGPCFKEKALGHFLTDPTGFCADLTPLNSTVTHRAEQARGPPLHYRPLAPGLALAP